MEPAYLHGTLVRLSPVPYLWATPLRGDVVGLLCPKDPERMELKRVVGLPGEHVSWKDGDIWINGQKLQEPYTRTAPSTPGESIQMQDLGPGEYFVAGDNRLYSQDSRTYGPVWLSDILGRVVEVPRAVLSKR